MLHLLDFAVQFCGLLVNNLAFLKYEFLLTLMLRWGSGSIFRWCFWPDSGPKSFRCSCWSFSSKFGFRWCRREPLSRQGRAEQCSAVFWTGLLCYFLARWLARGTVQDFPSFSSTSAWTGYPWLSILFSRCPAAVCVSTCT